MTTTVTDRIEKQVLLRAPRPRVWRAIADSGEFGTWFRAKFDSPFVQGTAIRGRITYPGYEHLTFEAFVERVEPEQYFALRWHPNAVDLNTDYSHEPTTLVEFRLAEAPEGTLLTITESGFDSIPLPRRGEAFRRNEQGWTAQTQNIERYVSES